MSLTNRQVVERWCDYISGAGVPRKGRNASGSIYLVDTEAIRGYIA